MGCSLMQIASLSSACFDSPALTILTVSIRLVRSLVSVMVFRLGDLHKYGSGEDFKNNQVSRVKYLCYVRSRIRQHWCCPSPIASTIVPCRAGKNLRSPASLSNLSTELWPTRPLAKHPTTLYRKHATLRIDGSYATTNLTRNEDGQIQTKILIQLYGHKSMFIFA